MRLIDFIIFSTALGLYWLTLSPGYLPADAGEFQLVAYSLGVAHPPGYPLYTLLGHGFTYLMPQNPARAVNLFSAVTAALTVTVLGQAVHRWTDRQTASVVAAIALIVVPSFWVTATQASIRPLTAFFVALTLERIATYAHTRKESALWSFFLALALGITHHPSVTFVGVFLLIYLLLIDGKLLYEPKHWLKPIGAAALGFLPWVYLPIRGAMNAPLAPDDLAAWAGFWRHVLARGFSGDLFAFSGLGDLIDRALVWGNIMVLQWDVILLLLIMVSAVLVMWKRWRVALALISGILLTSALTMTYRAPQTVEYLVPAYVLMAALLGMGFAQIGQITWFGFRARQWRRVQWVLLALLLFAIGLHSLRTWPSLDLLASDQSTQQFADALFEEAPDGAVILANWHHTMSLAPQQYIGQQRPDLEIFYVFPDGATPLAETWVQRIEQYIDERPVVVTGYYPVQFDTTGYVFEPLPSGEGWLVRREPRTAVRAGMLLTEAQFDGGVTLLGVDLPQSIPAGTTFEVQLAWRIDAEQVNPVSFYAHLSQPDGVVLSPRDISVDTSSLPTGSIIIEAFTLAPPATLPPGDYPILVGARSDDELFFTNGQQRVRVGTVTVTSAEYLPPTAEDAVPIGGEMVLTDVIVSHTELQPGDSLTVDLTFFSVAPGVNDRVIKVDIIGPDFAWRLQSDQIPATGAIPTLKWLYGWQIIDRHRFTIPENAAPGPVRAELVVYDHFTNAVLPVLDPTLAQQGEAVTIYTWQLTQ